MKSIKMQVTYKELSWMLEAMDELLDAYHKYKVNTKEIEKVRAHIVRKLLTMERREREENNENNNM